MPTTSDGSPIGAPAELESPQNLSELITFADAVGYVLGHFEKDTSAVNMQKARKAVTEAYRELCYRHEWSYFKRRGCINTVTAQSDGTVDFDLTGGAYERLLTLTGATWPEDISHSRVLIGQVSYPIAQRVDGTRVTLDSSCNPGEDLSDQSYTVYQAEYLLPDDLRKADDLIPVTQQWRWPTYITPQAGLKRLYAQWQPRSDPDYYTIRGSNSQIGSRVIEFFPPPLLERPYHYTYDRTPQRLQHFAANVEYTTGTVTVPAASSTVTGDGTTFTDNMVGCLIRFSADGDATVPTGLIGLAYGVTEYPYIEQHLITAVASATELTIAAPIESARSSATAYSISSPIDLHVDSILNCFHRLCEYKMSRLLPNRHEPKTADPSRSYKEDFITAYRQAKADDEGHVDPLNKTRRFHSGSLFALYPRT